MKATTPPPPIETNGLHLPTPPSTAKRVRFAEAVDVHSPIPQRRINPLEFQTLLQFEDPRDGGRRLKGLDDPEDSFRYGFVDDNVKDLPQISAGSLLPSPFPDDPTFLMELPFKMGSLTDLEAMEDEFSASVNSRDSGFPDNPTFVMELPFGIGNLTHLEAIEDEFSASVTPRDSGFPSDAFHFLGLPLDVRKKIYAIVLAVPVLICPRQRKTPVSDPYPISLNTVVEHRELLPGVAYVLCQAIVDDRKFHFYHFSFSNARVLRVNKQVHDEAKAVLYGENMFEIANLTSETIPKANFKISLFPRQYQDLIRTLTIKGRAMYAFRWILIKGHKELIKAYPALQSLDLIFEMENTQKGFAKKWARKEGEEWRPFIFRLRNALSQELYDCTGLVTCVPLWVNLRAVFAFERYDEAIDLELDQNFLDHVDKNNEEKVRQVELKRGMAEAFELFKRGFHP